MMPLQLALLDAPSPLGVGPTGVERLAEALRAAGLREALNAEDSSAVAVPSHDPRRDPDTLLLNPLAIRDFSRRLADAVGGILDRGRFPIVLGGDCSILIGDMLALRRRGRYGLFFLDGHADFYHPEASPTGAVSDMDLAIVTGHGPTVLTDIESRRPLVPEEDVVVFGYRDAEEAAHYGSRDVRNTAMKVYDLATVQALGAKETAAQALDHLGRAKIAGFWIHLDADVLDDAVMPAVDYRLPGGLSPTELSAVLRTLADSGKAVGLEITVFNPALDPNGSIARWFVRSIADGIVMDHGS
jgi:arginase